MAARPASGTSGTMYGLITFVILSVIMLGLFIWQLTINSDLRNAADEAARQRQTNGSPPGYYVNEASARRQAVFSVMNDDLEQLALLVSGQREAVRPAIVGESRRLLADVSGRVQGVVNADDTLLTAIGRLAGALATARDELAQEKAAHADAMTQNQNLTQALSAAKTEYSTEIASQGERVAQLEKDKQDQLTAKDEQLTQLTSQADSVQAELSRMQQDKQRSDRDNSIATERLRRQIQDLTAKIQELSPSGLDPYDILTKADGQVLRAIPGSDVVYINLGADARIRPGMTFEVFSPTGSRQRDFRGKASIEVNQVMETVSECVVKRGTVNQPIVEGDAIVNIAYEKDRKPQFVVRGEFDLDYDGAVDWDGLDRVKAIIQEWGGEVVEQVSESVDFLVVGMGPRAPSLPADRPMSVVVQELLRTQNSALEAWRAEIERASGIFVPVITQSQFLFLTGFPGQTPRGRM